MAAIFTIDDFDDFPPLGGSRRDSLPSKSNAFAPSLHAHKNGTSPLSFITTSSTSPISTSFTESPAIIELYTEDMSMAYPDSVSEPRTFHTPAGWDTPGSGGFNTTTTTTTTNMGRYDDDDEDVCEPVIEEPETPVTTTKQNGFSEAFSFATCLSVEESFDVSTSPGNAVSSSPIATSVSPSVHRHGKKHPFAGGRRRASITAISNSGFGSTLEVSVALAAAGRAGAGGLARMMALGEIESRGGSDVEDAIPSKKGGAKGRKWEKGASGFLMAEPTTSDEEDVFKFEKLPVSSYSSSPSMSGSDDEFIGRPVSPMPMKRSGLCELLEAQKLDDAVKKERKDSKAHPIEETYEIELDGEFVSQDVLEDTEAAENDHTLDHEHTHHEKVCADDFEKIKVLGKGTYGTVILVRHKPTGKLYAQKQLKKATVCVSKRLVGQTMSERAILEAVRHPFIVNLYYAFQDHEKLYLILEYAQGGELFWHLAQHRTFTEPMAAFYLACLALALHHLHTNCGVVYRDLKPENCLLDHEGYLLLTDFGLSKIATDDNRCTSMTGTPEYMAPEVIKEEEYDHAVDWWALGTLMYDLLTGGTPFVANNTSAIRQNVLKKKIIMPYYLSADAKSLLKGLLDRNPKKRLGANLKTDFEKIKKHRFFRTVDWKKLERRELVPPIRPTITDPAAAENFSCDFTKLGFSIGHAGPDSPLYVNDEGEAMFGGFSYKAPGEFFRH